MDEFHEQLTDTLRRKADSLDTTEVPLLPAYADDTPGGRAPRSRRVAVLAALAAAAVAAVGISVLFMSPPGGDPDRSVARDPEPGETEPTEIDSEPSPTSGEVHRVEIADRDMTVSVDIRPTYRRPPTETAGENHESLIHLERWLDPETGKGTAGRSRRTRVTTPACSTTR